MNPYWLICPQCGHRDFCRPAQLVQRMQQRGMLRRASDPDLELVEQLLAGALSRLKCTACEHEGLTAEEAEDDDEEWEDAAWSGGRSCQQCGQPLPPERLELYPAALHCADCESKLKDAAQVDHEYCPRCGTPMLLKAHTRGGLARYEYQCPQCRN